ncbi:MAG: sulfate ABC transporter substrate-binding protein [Verrucomicrobia bacterium]|nr:sulfate ABC transporter substrate-binding protein [Verrucomicrobiota bacterium]
MRLSTLILSSLALSISVASAGRDLLNVSYDPTRELYAEFNPVFVKYWKGKTGENVSIRQSHGGSGKQARAVIDGLKADVVTFALAGDVDALYANGGLIPENWATRLPDNSAPYTSTIVFLVRKGNPKGVKDWSDLIKPGLQVITPNPKTSGGARWNYLAAYAYAEKAFGKDDARVLDFIGKLYKNVPVLDSGARGSTTTFIQREIGDVLLTWENEAFLALKEFGADKFQIVAPPQSILAEASVSVVDKNVDAKKTRDLAEAYLKHLYSDEGQDIIGKNFYRPRSQKALAKYGGQFPKIELVTIDGAFGGWNKAQRVHFADGGTFDQIYKP